MPVGPVLTTFSSDVKLFVNSECMIINFYTLYKIMMLIFVLLVSVIKLLSNKVILSQANCLCRQETFSHLLYMAHTHTLRT